PSAIRALYVGVHHGGTETRRNANEIYAKSRKRERPERFPIRLRSLTLPALYSLASRLVPLVSSLLSLCLRVSVVNFSTGDDYRPNHGSGAPAGGSETSLTDVTFG